MPSMRPANPLISSEKIRANWGPPTDTPVFEHIPPHHHVDNHTPRSLRRQIVDRIVIFRGEVIAWGQFNSRQNCRFVFLGHSESSSRIDFLTPFFQMFWPLPDLGPFRTIDYLSCTTVLRSVPWIGGYTEPNPPIRS